jgi:hypothetical protein
MCCREHLQAAEVTCYWWIFFKRCRLHFNSVFAITSVTSLAVPSSSSVAAHNDNYVTPPPFHLSVCWHISTASDPAFHYELLWKNHGHVGSVRNFYLIWTMVNWSQLYQKLSITCRDSRDQIFSFLLFLSRGSHTLLGVFAKFRRASISFVMSVCPSVCPHGTTRLTVDGFRCNLLFGYFSKMCREALSLMIMGKNNGYCTRKLIHVLLSISLNSPLHEKCFGQSCRKNQNSNFIIRNFVSKIMSFMR